MRTSDRTITATLVTVMTVAVVSAFAQQQAVDRPPTKDDPLRFSAFAVQMQSGISGRVDIVIERWSTEEERQSLIALVKTSTDRLHGQEELLNALQDVEPRTGYMRTSRSLGWDLKYTHQDVLPDGSRPRAAAQ